MLKHFMLVLLSGLPQLAAADFQTGGDAYKAGDYETAAKEFLPLAEDGDHRAMYALGSMYSAGHGVPQDYAEAFKWFQRAAKFGRPDAEYKIGLLYFNGLGTEKSERNAFNWFGKAAKKGLNTAQFRVGEMYAAGMGVRQNTVKAYAWLTIALEQGVSEARPVLDSVTENLTPEQLEDATQLAESYRNLYARK